VVGKTVQGDKNGPNYENHEDENENALAASPSALMNPSIQQPEMIGRLRLSSIDPRSNKRHN
jgi:hypothetical protein